MLNINDIEESLELTYPREWRYTVIGGNEEKLRAAIAQIMGENEYKLNFSKTSSRGKYISLSLVTIVTDERHRTSIFEKLKQSPDIAMVM